MQIIFALFFTSLTSSLGSKVLIVTGHDTQTPELIDLEDPTFKCNQELPDFPEDLRGATGALIEGKIPFVCGGLVGPPLSKKCYQMGKNGSWIQDEFGLTVRRYFGGVGSVVIDGHMVLSGGSSGPFGDDLNSMEMVQPGAESKDLPIQLPVGLLGHCMVSLNSTSFMIIGGSTNGPESAKSYVINVESKVIESGPELMHARDVHACSEIEIDGKQYIIIAGGSFQIDQKVLSSTELLDRYDFSQGWQKGADLPTPLHSHQMVSSPDKKKVYAIGGKFGIHAGEYNIYQYTCSGDITTCQWNQIETKLKERRNAFVAMPIPEDLAEQLCQ